MALNEFTPPSDRAFQKPRRAWRPRVRSGYFYINGRRYYLYGDKATHQLSELTQSRFQLDRTPFPRVGTGTAVTLPSGVKVEVDGQLYNDWEIHGNELRVNHLEGAEQSPHFAALTYDSTRWGENPSLVFGPGNEVRIDYEYLEWSATGHAFVVTQATEYFTFDQGEAKYILPSEPAPGAPIIITDDSIRFHDQRGFAVEFAYDPATRELTFNQHPNEILNPSFEDAPSDDPEDAQFWELSGSFRRRTDGYHGLFAMSVDPTGYALQTIDIDPDLTFTFSSWVRGTGTARLVVNYVDATGGVLDPTGGVIGQDDDTSLESAATGLALSGVWEQMGLTIGEELEPYDVPLTGIPDSTHRVDLYLKASGTAVDFDGVQFTETPFIPEFAYVDPASTVEFEQSGSGLYTWTPKRSAPFLIGDVDFNSVHEDIELGFLTQAEFSDRSDWGLGKGHTVFTLPPTGEYGIWLGTGTPPTGLVQSETAEISVDQGFSVWPSGTTQLAHIDVGTGFTTPSGTWQSDIVSDIQTKAFTNAAVDGIAFHGVRELVEATDEAFANDTLQQARDAATGVKSDAVFAVFDAWRSVGTGQYTGATGVASWIDILGLEGLCRDRKLHRNTQLERHFGVQRTIDTANFVWDQGQRDLQLVAVDFEPILDPDIPDWYDRAEFRAFAIDQRFDHFVAPTGFDTFLEQYRDTYVPLGVPPVWATGVDETPQETLGRKHLPHAKVDGRQKLVKVATFGLTNPTLDAEEFFREAPPQPADIVVDPLHDATQNAQGEISMLLSQGATGLCIVELLDRFGNPLPRYPVSVTAPTGTVDPELGYTNQQGRLYVNYVNTGTPTGTFQDEIIAICRLDDDITAVLPADVI